MANRVLDWSDFRIFRVRDGAVTMVYRGALGWPNGATPIRQPSAPAHRSGDRRGGGDTDARSDGRVLAPTPDAVACWSYRSASGTRSSAPWNWTTTNRGATARRRWRPPPPLPASSPPRFTSPTSPSPGGDGRAGTQQVQVLITAATAFAARRGRCPDRAGHQGRCFGAGASGGAGREATAGLAAQAREVAKDGAAAGAASATAAETAALIVTRSRMPSGGWCSCSSSCRQAPAGRRSVSCHQPAHRVYRHHPGNCRPHQPDCATCRLEAARAGHQGRGFAVVAEEVASSRPRAGRPRGRPEGGGGDPGSGGGDLRRNGSRQRNRSRVEQLSGDAARALDGIVAGTTGCWRARPPHRQHGGAQELAAVG